MTAATCNMCFCARSLIACHSLGLGVWKHGKLEMGKKWDRNRNRNRLHKYKGLVTAWNGSGCMVDWAFEAHQGRETRWVFSMDFLNAGDSLLIRRKQAALEEQLGLNQGIEKK